MRKKIILRKMKMFFCMRARALGFLLVVTIFLTASPDFISALENTDQELNILEGNRIELPLKSVIVLALKNNLQIAFARLNPEVSHTDIMGKESVYDPDVSLQFSKTRDVNQVGNILSGAGKDTVYQESHGLDLGVTKTFVTGTSAELNWTLSDSTTDFLFQTLVPQYKSELSISLTQPLLKDFGIAVGKSMIKIANLNFKISQSQFKSKVMDILYQTEQYYWNLFFQLEDLEARKKSLKLAEDLLRQHKIKIEAGTLAPIEIYQAEAEVAERKQDLIVARDLVRDTEDKLKSALNLYEQERYWDLVIIPADEPRAVALREDLQEGIKQAFAYRPDYLQAKLDIESKNIMVKYTKNQVLPRVDLIGTLGTMGLGGRTNPEASSFMGGGGGEVTNPWARHWDDVADSMASGDFYNYTVGIKIEFPLGNRYAESQYSRAKIQAAQAVTYLKDVENSVVNEVREAVRQIDTNLERLEAANASLRLSREKLKAEEKKYEVGLSTTHDLLEFQDDLARSESRLALARADYEKSLANLARVKGVLLEGHNIVIN